MTLTLTYDATLARVKVDKSGIIGVPFTAGFEVSTAGWEGVGGTLVRSTAQFHSGVASALLTPDGVTSVARIRTLLADSPVVVPGERNEFSVWVRCAVARDVDISVEYHNAADSPIDFTILTTTAVAANTWTKITGQRTAVPGSVRVKLYVNMRTTPAAGHLLYVDDAQLRTFTATPTFEVDTEGWTVAGGALTRSTAQFHSGVASGLLTPDAASSYPGIFYTAAASPVAFPGEEVQWSAWVRSATGHQVTISINWLDDTDNAVSLDLLTVETVPNTWKQVTMKVPVPEGVAKAQPVVANTASSGTSDLLYVDDTELIVTKAYIERSQNEITWTGVRGGMEIASGASGTGYDYEFVDGVENFYRVRGEVASITPDLGGVWLKSITRPFLNRMLGPAAVVDSTFSRDARMGVFDVIGRSAPVAVTDVRGGKNFGLRIISDTDQDSYTLDYLTASGDILYLHAPSAGRIPTAYVAVGTTSRKYHGVSRISTWLMDMTEVQAPGPEVSGSTVTWGTIIANFASWSEVIAFFPTWADVLEYVADPSEVEVS